MSSVWWPVYARLTRGQVLSVKSREHVEAATAGGAGHLRTLVRHILPLCWSPILVNATMDFGQVVLLTASLSFIGLGASPPTPEWGSMISKGAIHFYQWWICAGPGVAILRSEEHTTELQSLMHLSNDIFCSNKKQHVALSKQ